MGYGEWFLIALVCFGLLLAGYYVFVMTASRGRTIVLDPAGSGQEGVSVVVVSRNGLESLRSLIPSLLAQKYPRFEIVVVNDRSFDNTDVFLKSIQRNYPTVLRVATIPADTSYPWAGRKFAIAMGVKAAQYDRIVLLNNTAVPASENWLDTFVSAFNEPTEYVIGYTVLRGGTAFSKAGYFTRMADSLAWAGAGKPYRAYPSNFSFRKSTFLSRNGYMKDMRVPSGEADFLLQDDANEGNTAILTVREAMTMEKTVLSHKERREKQVEDYATYRRYSLSAKFKTLLPYFLKAFFLLSAVVYLVIFPFRWAGWAIVGVVTVLSWVNGLVCARRFHYTRWMAVGLCMDIVLLPLNLLRTIVAAASLPRMWK